MNQCHSDIVTPPFGIDDYADSMRVDLHHLVHAVDRLSTWVIAPAGLISQETLVRNRSDCIADLIDRCARIVSSHTWTIERAA
jgi:hypothetical protein